MSLKTKNEKGSQGAAYELKEAIFDEISKADAADLQFRDFDLGNIDMKRRDSISREFTNDFEEEEKNRKNEKEVNSQKSDEDSIEKKKPAHRSFHATTFKRYKSQLTPKIYYNEQKTEKIEKVEKMENLENEINEQESPLLEPALPKKSAFQGYGDKMRKDLRFTMGQSMIKRLNKPLSIADSNVSQSQQALEMIENAKKYRSGVEIKKYLPIFMKNRLKPPRNYMFLITVSRILVVIAGINFLLIFNFGSGLSFFPLWSAISLNLIMSITVILKSISGVEKPKEAKKIPFWSCKNFSKFFTKTYYSE